MTAPPLDRLPTTMPSGQPYASRLGREALAAKAADILSVLSPRRRPYGADPVRRIGVIAQWGIGDAVLLMPLLRGLKRSHPEASIEVIGKPWLRELFAGEDCCDETHVLVPPLTAYTRKYRPTRRELEAYLTQLRALRAVSFDWLVSARFDPREALQLRLLRARETFGFRVAGGRGWITRDLGLDRPALDAMHRAALSRAVLAAIDGTVSVEEPEFHVDPEAKARAREWLRGRGYVSGPILAVHTGAGHPIRQWREPGFDTVIRTLRIRPSMIVFLSAEGDAPAIDALSVPCVVWQSGLRELKALLSACHVFLGTDSGVMHMAAAAGCRVVAAFGPAEPRWFAPAGADHRVVLVDPMPCRPCFDACIHARPWCLDRLADSSLAGAADAAIEEAWRETDTAADATRIER